MKVELLKPHTHAQMKMLPGDILDLPDDAARWLIEAGVAREAPAAPPAPKSDKPNRKE